MTSLGWPQLILISLIVLRVGASLFAIFALVAVKNQQKAMETIGGLLGYLVSVAILIALLVWGGFFTIHNC